MPRALAKLAAMETALSGPGWACLWPIACELGEGPIWDADRQLLWFVDIERGNVNRFDPASGAQFSWRAPCRIGSVALRAGGGMIAGTEHGFALIDPEAGTFELIGNPEPHLPGNRFNDGKVDAGGNFWAGTMDDAKRATSGALYRLDRDHRWTVADCGYRITNGPAFSPDGRTLYHNETVSKQGYAFDLAADGSLSNKRLFVDWSTFPGHPDGLTVDADGYVWQACWGAACVRRVSPAGVIVAEHALPASNVSSCTFGGANFERLFVTTARELLDADQLAAQPLAGGLFEIFPDVCGLPAGIYTG